MVAGLTAVLLLASVVQAVSGFGFALLSMPLLSVIVDTKDAVAVSTLVGTLASTVMLARHRRHVCWPLVWPLLGGALAGMPVGLYVLIVLDERLLRLVLAGAVLVSVFVLARGWQLEGRSRRFDLGAGFLSGVLNTSVSTNGPPLVLALQARGLEPDAFRATISALFVAGAVGANLLLAGAGRYTNQVLAYAAVGAPALLVGGLIGTRLARRLAAARFRPLVLGLLVVAAMAAGAGALLP